MDFNTLTVRDYIREIGIILSRDHHLYDTPIPALPTLQNGIYEIIGKTISGRTTLALAFIAENLKKGVLSLYVDTTGRLDISNIKSAGINPEYLPIIGLNQIDSLKEIISQGLIKLIVIDELTPIGKFKISEFMNSLNKSRSLKYDIMVLIINQYRHDIKTNRKVSAHRSIIAPYLHGTFVLVRAEEMFGGILTQIIFSNKLGNKWTKKYSIIIKNNSIPYVENLLVYAINIGIAHHLERKIVIEDISYPLYKCLKDDKFILHLQTSIQNSIIEKENIEQTPIEINVSKIVQSPFRFSINQKSSSKVLIHPNRIDEVKET